MAMAGAAAGSRRPTARAAQPVDTALAKATRMLERLATEQATQMAASLANSGVQNDFVDAARLFVEAHTFWAVQSAGRGSGVAGNGVARNPGAQPPIVLPHGSVAS